MDVENSWSDMEDYEYGSDIEYISEEIEHDEIVKPIPKQSLIKKDFQPLILLLETESGMNPRSEGILRTIEIILSEFTSAEVYEVISIYNNNKNALTERARFLEEFVLILFYFESIGIMVTKNIFPILFPKMHVVIDQTLTEKKFKRIKKHVRQTFNLDEMFRVKELGSRELTLSTYIKYYANGYMLAIKHLVKNYNTDNMDTDVFCEYEKLIKILPNTNLPFVEDEKLQYLSKWLDGTIKNLILFAEWNAVYDKNFFRFNRRQSKDYMISSYVSVLFYIIDVLKAENTKHYKVSLKSFLLVLDDEGIVEELLDNSVFLEIIKTIANTGKKTVGLKKFVSQMDKFMTGKKTY